MLPNLHSRLYQKWLTTLEQLQHNALHPEASKELLRKNFQPVQIFFQTEIINLTSAELDPALAPKWQSIQREIHRGYKLLETDMMFLQSSRQPQTTQARIKTIQQRLEQLIGYCQQML